MAGRPLDMTDARTYPRHVECGAHKIILRRMTAEDEAGILAFAKELPSTDLLFLRRDITEPKVVAAWLRDIADGEIETLLALAKGRIVGCAAIVTNKYSWSRHVGELRVLVLRDFRGTGLGRVLTQEAFALAIGRGMERLVAQMTPDQTGAISMFESLGFRAEALLRDHVKDRDGVTHDLVMLGHDVARVRAQMEAYGLNEAF
jgi:L-amino acid N-acyltransferase YncA